MNKCVNKRIMLILSILMIFFVIGAVSAGDDSNMTVGNVDNEILMVNDASDLKSADISDNTLNTEDNSSFGSFNDLQSDIDNAKNSIVLNRDYSFTVDDSNSNISSSGIVIAQDNFVLDGNNHTVDAKSISRIFTITGNNVLLKNIILTNAYLDNMINIKESGDYCIGYNGAAIEWIGENATLIDSTITNSVIANNIVWKTSDTDSTYVMGNGAAVAFYGSNMNVANVNITDNTILSLFSQDSFTGETLNGIISNGAALFFSNSVSTVNVKNSIFRNNIIKSSESISGCVMYIGCVAYFNANNNIIDFENSDLVENSGGIYVRNNTGDIIVSGNSINNNANGVVYVINNYGNISLNGIFDDNGLVVHVNDNYGNILLSGEFTNNVGLRGSCCWIENDCYGNVSLIGQFNNNTASAHGGVITFTGYNCTVILNGTFNNNHAGTHAGVCYNTQGTDATIILIGDFINNTAGYMGSVLRNDGVTSTVITNGNFINNTDYVRGVFLVTGDDTMYINGTFINNTPSVVYSTKELSNEVIITGNFADNYNGTLLYFSGVISGNVTINGTFYNNTGNIGSVARFTNTISGNVIIDGLFENNTASVGTVVVSSMDNVDSTATFSNNIGGDLGVYKSLTSTLKTQIIDINNLTISVSKFLPNTTVKVKIGDNNYEIELDENGTGNITMKVDPGVWETLVYYEGDDTYLPVTNKYNLTVLDSNEYKSFTELNQFIRDNINNGTIYLDSNYAYDEIADEEFSVDGISLSEGLTNTKLIIDGNGHIIDGSFLSGIFRSSTGNKAFVIKNITIKNAYTTGSGAVFYTNNFLAADGLTLMGNFTNNRADYGGGVVFIAKGNLYLNGTFINNTSPRGGVFYTDTTGNDKCNYEIYGLYINNSATDGGVGRIQVVNVPSIKIIGDFINNTATNGGVLKLERRTTVSDFYAEGNFDNNYAYTGGVFYFYSDTNKNTATVQNATLKGNYTNNVVHWNGGVINAYNVTNLTLDGNFVNNHYDDDKNDHYGGVAQVNTVENLNLIGNYTNNTSRCGGVAQVGTAGNILLNGSFEDNIAEFYNYGGGVIRVNDADNITLNGEYVSNGAQNNGGVVYVNNVNNIISNATFLNNYAIGSGGVLYVVNTSANTTLNGNYSSNYAYSNGGVAYFNNVSDLTVNDLYEKNSASYGGAIYILNADNVTSSDALFDSNTASYGSSIYIRNADNVTVENSSFNNNTAIYGSGIVLFEVSDANITNSSFTNNTANIGAGLAVNSDNVAITNSLFYNNTATTGSGVLAVADNLKVYDSNFTKNNASMGAGLVAKGDNTTISNTVFDDNEAIIGAGILSDANSTTIIDSEFTGNDADVGAGIVSSGDDLKVDNSSFTNNTAVTGAGIQSKGNNANITNSTFENNNDSNGAAIIITGNNAALSDNNITGNEGSAIIVNGDNATVVENTIANNTETGIIINGNDISCANNTFGDNNETDILIGKDSNMNTPENVKKISEDNSNAVAKADVGLKIIISPEIVHVDENMTVTITLSNKTGKVKVTVDNYTSELTAVDGIITMVLPEYPVGEYEISASIGATEIYNAGDVNVTVKVQNWNFTELQQLIDENTNGTIDLNHNFVCEEDESPVTINKSITVNGNDYTIDANNADNVFNISADDVELNNMTIVNTKENAIKVLGNGTRISGITLENNTGDGIFAEGNGTIIENITANNHTGDVISVKGDNSVVDGVIANDGAGVVVSVEGDYPVVKNISAANHEGDLLLLDGKGSLDSLHITVDDVDYTVAPQVNITADVDGLYVVTVDDTEYNVTVSNGKGNITLPKLPAGTYNATVRGLIENYDIDPKTANFTVEENINVEADDLTKYFSAPDNFTVNVTDINGDPVVNKTVKITLNNVEYTRTTNENGSVFMRIRLNSGVYEAIVSVGNITLNRTITILSTINGTDIVKIFRNGTQYYVTAKDANGSYLPEGSKVEFNINGVFYNRTVKDNEGLVKLNINLQEGEYIVTATNLETKEMTSNIIKVISSITGENITKYYRNGTQYCVTLLDDNGNPVGAGVSVTFNINGVFYTRQTNASGVAKLNINLDEGNYTVTADYNGCLISNNIEVLPVLSAKDLVKQENTNTPFVVKLVDGQGNPYEDKDILFNINGVLYSRTTDSDGQAKLNINLPYGKYIITSSYNGCSISNTIMVTY